MLFLKSDIMDPLVSYIANTTLLKTFLYFDVSKVLNICATVIGSFSNTPHPNAPKTIVVFPFLWKTFNILSILSVITFMTLLDLLPNDIPRTFTAGDVINEHDGGSGSNTWYSLRITFIFFE